MRTSRCCEILAAVVRVEQLAALQRLGHRVDREVALGEVGLDVVVAQRDQVDVPGVLGPDDAPGAERAAELERRPAGGLGQLAREPLRVAGDREVDVVGVAPEQLVAHGAADEPRVLAGQHLAREVERLAAPSGVLKPALVPRHRLPGSLMRGRVG